VEKWDTGILSVRYQGRTEHAGQHAGHLSSAEAGQALSLRRVYPDVPGAGLAYPDLRSFGLWLEREMTRAMGSRVSSVARVIDPAARENG
jgi:hypothetical protein